MEQEANTEFKAKKTTATNWTQIKVHTYASSHTDQSSQLRVDNSVYLSIWAAIKKPAAHEQKFHLFIPCKCQHMHIVYRKLSHTHKNNKTFGDTVKKLSFKTQKFWYSPFVYHPIKRPTVTHAYIPHAHTLKRIRYFRENNKQTKCHLSCFRNFSLLLNEIHLVNELDHFDAPTMNCSHINCDP